MSESEETYDDKRARMLEILLRELAARIGELDGRGELLRYAGKLTKRIGDIRSELFHYEVRATYDTPDIAENRRIVDDAQKRSESQWQTKEWTADEDDDPAGELAAAGPAGSIALCDSRYGTGVWPPPGGISSAGAVETGSGAGSKRSR